MKLRFSNKSQSTSVESAEVKISRGFIPAGITPSALISIRQKIGITTSSPTPPPEGGGIVIGGGGFQGPTWLLGSAIWNDSGEWFDNANWID